MNPPGKAFGVSKGFNSDVQALIARTYGSVQPLPDNGQGLTEPYGYRPLQMPLFFPVSAPIFIESLTKKDARAPEKSPAFLSAYWGKTLEVFERFKF
jgi:hypothetical protein